MNVSGGSTLNFTSGTINSTSLNHIRDNSTMTVSGGDWVLNDNNALRIYSGSVLNVSSGSVGYATAGYYVLGATSGDATVNLSGTASFGTSNAYAFFGDSIGANVVFNLIGSGVTTASSKASLGPSKSSSTTTLGYVADSSGVSVFTTSGAMALTGATGSAALSVDLSALVPGTGTITLADYSTLSGAFGTTTIFSGATTFSAGTLGSLSAGEYAIDYAGAGGTIQLQYNAQLQYNEIPEPGTYALLAGLFGLGYVMLRRRKA